MDSFGRYLKAEIEAIREFRITESRKYGRELTRNEAAALWAETRAATFRANYREEGTDGRPGSQTAGTTIT